MKTLLWAIIAALLGIHGLIHLMGFFAYWPLLTLTDLPYKTALLGGALDLGAVGMRVYSVLWLAAALGFISTSLALVVGWKRWQPVLLVSVLISAAVTILDWSTAFRGTFIDLALLLILVYFSQNSRLLILRGR
ncbi:MAG: ABC transporter permease [Chloroflexi bacterium]|nr:ABC transporter permease [Chloroflexota bacterium]MCC6893947.1 ABC transporter permease [Anaerolineae bacterium]